MAVASAVAGLVAGGRAGSSPEDGAAGRPAPSGPVSAAAALPLERRIGELLVMSFDGTSVPPYISRRLRAGRGTGVILFAKNLPDRATARSVTGELRRASRGRALVAIDQEGGEIRSAPFAAPAVAPPGLASPAAAARAARAGARDLRGIGIQVNLAPVADVPEGPGSVMAGRAFPGDAARVARSVAAAVRAHEREGVAATAKHFPGLGRATANTDDRPVTVGAPAGALGDRDLVPFAAAVRAGAPLAMTSHALYPALDPKRIASQSPAVHRLLREKLGFEGVVITDSVEADAVLARSGVAAAAERSVAAGADLVLMTGSASWNAVAPRLLRRARRDARFRARVTEAAGRVLALKRRLGLRAGR